MPLRPHSGLAGQETCALSLTEAPVATPHPHPDQVDVTQFSNSDVNGKRHRAPSDRNPKLFSGHFMLRFSLCCCLGQAILSSQLPSNAPSLPTPLLEVF